MMTINYPTPVTVNGFACRNCTDVDYAKKHIDPAHPESGPYGKDAKDDPAVKNPPSSGVVFGGGLASLNANPTKTVTDGLEKPSNLQGIAGAVPVIAIGSRLDVSA
jgi:hypothetical protein